MNPFIKRNEELVKPNRIEFLPNEPFDEAWNRYTSVWLENEDPSSIVRDGNEVYLKAVEDDRVIMAVDGAKLVTEPETGRARFYLDQPRYEYNEVFASSLMIVTATGNKPERPAGHVHVDKMDRWIIYPLSQFIEEQTKLAGTPLTEEQELVGSKIKFEMNSKTFKVQDGKMSGVLRVSEIINGPQAGRIWSVYYPKGLRFDLLTKNSLHSFWVNLGFGQTIQQGADKNKSEAGSTHIVLEKFGIRPNFIQHNNNYAN